MSMIDPNDPEIARMMSLMGAGLQPIPNLIVTNEEDGKKFLVQRVAVMLMADDLTAKIAATVALAVTKEVLGALEDAGVAPKGTLQKYESDVESLEATPPPSGEGSTSTTASPENRSGIPEEP